MKDTILISSHKRVEVYEGIYRLIEHYKNCLSSERERVFLMDYNLGDFSKGEFSLRSMRLDIFVEDGMLTIIHPILDSESLLGLCFVLDAISRNRLPLKNLKIKLHFPYIFYARYDGMFKKCDSVPIEVILEIILSHCHYVTEMHFYDIHSDSCLKKIPQKIKTYNHSFNKMFQKICPRYIPNIFDKDTVVVAPDIGATKRARNFALCIKGNFDIAIIDKIQTNIDESHIMNMVGQDVKNKVCVITDDIVDSAETLYNTANFLKEKGAIKVYACITHGIFSDDAIYKINYSAIDKLFVTDSNIFDTKKSKKIQIIPLGTLFAYNEISNRFKDHDKFHNVIEHMDLDDDLWDIYPIFDGIEPISDGTTPLSRRLRFRSLWWENS